MVIAILVKLTSRGPVFFKQERVGRFGKIFRIIKFRTMIENAENVGPAITISADNRITKVGKYIRKLKIDELPQLINVLKGDISFVGPRPELQKYVEIFSKEYEEILKIKPGITDYAAIAFSSENEIIKNKKNPEEYYIKEILPKKIELYKKYMDEMNLILDIKLIILTLNKIILKKWQK